VNLLHWLLEGSIGIGSSAILVREVVGNGFGIASALGGMRRKVWAWPVGIAGNLLLFTVFVGGIFDKPQVHDLWGQAGRQVFFLAVSVYGWWRWRRGLTRRLGPAGTGSEASGGGGMTGSCVCWVRPDRMIRSSSATIAGSVSTCR